MPWKGEPMDDLISRQAAIDVLQTCYDSDSVIFKNGYAYIRYDQALQLMGKLPFAQPEIIRCKDCKHYGCILYSGTQFEYGECFGHEESDYTFKVKPDDFCSRAERRTDG